MWLHIISFHSLQSFFRDLETFLEFPKNFRGNLHSHCKATFPWLEHVFVFIFLFFGAILYDFFLSFMILVCVCARRERERVQREKREMQIFLKTLQRAVVFHIVSSNFWFSSTCLFVFRKTKKVVQKSKLEETMLYKLQSLKLFGYEGKYL